MASDVTDLKFARRLQKYVSSKQIRTWLGGLWERLGDPPAGVTASLHEARVRGAITRLLNSENKGPAARHDAYMGARQYIDPELRAEAHPMNELESRALTAANKKRSMHDRGVVDIEKTTREHQALKAVEKVTGRSKMANVHSSYMKPLLKEIRASIRVIEGMMDSTAVKYADPGTKKAVSDLLSEYEALKTLKADKETIDSLSKELTTNVDKAETAERAAKIRRMNELASASDDALEGIDDKSVDEAKRANNRKAAETPAETARAATANESGRPSAGQKSAAYGDKGVKMRAGWVDEFLDANPKAKAAVTKLMKDAGLSYDGPSIGKGNRLYFAREVPGLQSTMLEYATERSGGAKAPPATPPAEKPAAKKAGRRRGAGAQTTPPPAATPRAGGPKWDGVYEGGRGKGGGTVSGGQANEVYKAMSAADKKKVDKFLEGPGKGTGKQIRGAIDAAGLRDKAIAFAKGKRVAPPVAPAAATTPAAQPAPTRVERRGRGKGGVSPTEAAARRGAAAQAIPPPVSEADGRAAATKERSSPKGLREQAADLELNAKARAQGRSARYVKGRPTQIGGRLTMLDEPGQPTSKQRWKAEAKEMLKEAKRLRALANEVESGQPPPKETPRPATQRRARAGYTPPAPAKPAPPTARQEAGRKAAATRKRQADEERAAREKRRASGRKAAVTTQLRKGLNEELAKGKRRDAHAKGVVTKADKARAEAAGRAKRSAASTKGSVKTENLRKAYIAEGLTPEQARSKAGRETVELMREVKGKKGTWEGSKTPHKGKIKAWWKTDPTLIDLPADVSDDVAKLLAKVEGATPDDMADNLIARARRLAASGTGKSAAKLLKAAARIAGPAGVAYELAVKFADISEKPTIGQGIKHALREDEAWLADLPLIPFTGKHTLAKRKDMPPTLGSPTTLIGTAKMGPTRVREKQVRFAIKKFGPKAVGMRIGKAGESADESIARNPITQKEYNAVRLAMTRDAPSPHGKDTSAWAKEQKAKNIAAAKKKLVDSGKTDKAKEAAARVARLRQLTKAGKTDEAIRAARQLTPFGSKAVAEEDKAKEATRQKKIKRLNYQINMAKRKERRFNAPASKVKSTWDKAKGQGGKFLARTLESQADPQAVAKAHKAAKLRQQQRPSDPANQPRHSQADKQAAATRRTLKAMRGRGPTTDETIASIDKDAAWKADERKRRLARLRGAR